MEDFSTRTRALAERDSGLRSGDARFRLPLAEMLDVLRDVLGRQEGLARTDLGLRYGFRTEVWQQDQNDTQPECHPQDEPHSPALFPGGAVTFTSFVFLPTNLNREWSMLCFQRDVAVAIAGCGSLSETHMLGLACDWRLKKR
jgi:hypothetical protein